MATEGDSDSERFQVCREGEHQHLGQGGAGRVLLGVDTESGERCAVKIFRSGAKGCKEAQRESAMLRRLQHPCIVTLLGLARGPDTVCLGFELAQSDLYRELQGRGGSLPEGEAKLHARSLLTALAHLAHSGVAHRDVKPSNCLLFANPDGVQLKLSDFDAAVEAAELSAAAVGKHTAGYRAPEALMGQQIPLQLWAADSWAAGLCIAEMLLGRNPLGVVKDSSLHQLKCMLGLVPGSVLPADLPGVSKDTAAVYEVLRADPGSAPLRDRLAAVCDGPAELGELLTGLLRLDPRQRTDPRDAATHPCFGTAVADPASVRLAWPFGAPRPVLSPPQSTNSPAGVSAARCLNAAWSQSTSPASACPRTAEQGGAAGLSPFSPGARGGAAEHDGVAPPRRVLFGQGPGEAPGVCLPPAILAQEPPVAAPGGSATNPLGCLQAPGLGPADAAGLSGSAPALRKPEVLQQP
eukprot:TRINITY_DN11270_c0_g1_i2.p1 TRINITY_DN11270_c0_g1~~TRINITY_DN11270_c0_g1_i2.p1  ORF type:complete len:466 (+),score=124.58 TRINITY_DN11270_c0_g1_i2:76-1473(+)